MWLYHKFGKMGYKPWEVRELTLAEQYWLPVMEDAENIASVQISQLNDN
jgi:hypothetical protein